MEDDDEDDDDEGHGQGSAGWAGSNEKNCITLTLTQKVNVCTAIEPPGILAAPPQAAASPDRHPLTPSASP